MDLPGLLIGLLIGMGLGGFFVVSWLYEPDAFPGPLVMAQHLRAARTFIRILRIHSDALAQMLADAERYRRR